MSDKSRHQFAHAHYHKMPDGTIKQTNPFTGTAVWNVPGRGNKPISNAIPDSAKKIEITEPEDYCNFCPTHYFSTPPEKARMVEKEGKHVILKGVKAENLGDTNAEFRRVPNLFEIVTYDYWVKNYDYEMTEENRQRKTNYLSSVHGIRHVIDIVDLKLKVSGFSDQDIQKLPMEDKLGMSNAFFGGGHELIVPRRHYKPDAQYDVELCSSGELTPEEHFRYFTFTIEAMKDIVKNNRYVRYVSVFQNWLSSAGASFDHLHKQLVAIDEWGVAIERELNSYRTNPNYYNEMGANFAGYHNLVFAENDHAIAYVEIGRRYPTIAIYSKSEHAMPQEHTSEEIRGISDLVHACHAAMGSGIPCNEEWYYSPIDATENIPWHILIRWRTSNPAGFEGGTRIYVNPVSPEELRDKIVPRLFELKNQGKIEEFPVAFECPCVPNSLRYIVGSKSWSPDR
uniref:Galactose-1-phosphate uridylyltransferase n=1 Tax=Candidatus Kentrum sp. LFY TaxID=2126342 RepID=A0A450U591_9GAMM|nr:MAG: Galactose-1-phosphate uridylyltransferase [Candidatus Kentron sp. LFY]VFJ92672.1 MAG: Galactose-1-phosphate uridylyltransferase [Candidatus Kentron sp. LFY]VFK13044.1 MAG: Galactose-1-phosphate uridylyltransferase [Candidatus Kentron sp. LFY]